VSSDLDGLPGGEICINSFEQGDLLLEEAANLGGVVNTLNRAEPSQLVHLAVEVGDLLFKTEVIDVTEIVVSFRHILASEQLARAKARAEDVRKKTAHRHWAFTAALQLSLIVSSIG